MSHNIYTQLQKCSMKCINLSKWDVIELSEYKFICIANKDCSVQAKGFVFVGDSCTLSFLRKYYDFSENSLQSMEQNNKFYQ